MSEIISCTHKVTLDIAKRDVHMIQVIYGDTANILEVNLCENGKEISLENATLATITYSNNTFDEMQISEDYRTASVRINANCLKQGLNFAQISIYSGDNGLITADMLTIDCNQKIGGENPSCPNADMPKLKELINQLIQQGMADGISPEQIADAVANYLTENPIEETDPNVHEWAKAEEKPTYTAEEVGALSEKTLKPAVGLALAQAKASGDFDGADGITPTIGDNGNWFLGDTDTKKPSRGDKGDTGARGEKGDTGAKGEKGDTGATGAAGKSAYSYAQDGGYTGTEEEFAAKLAEEQLVGTTDELTPTQVYEAVSTGRPVKVQYTDSTYGLLSFTAFNVSESLNVIVSEIVAYGNGVYMLCELVGYKSSNAWGFNITTLAQKTDIPAALPNPNALTFTGAVAGSYDGSEPVTVEIPSGGGSGWKTIADYTLEIESNTVVFNVDADGNPFSLKEVIASIHVLPNEDATNGSYIKLGFNATNVSASELQTMSGTPSSGYVWVDASLRFISGFWRVESCYLSTNTLVKQGNHYGGIVPNKVIGESNWKEEAKAIVIYSNVNLGVGTTIKIYGR